MGWGREARPARRPRLVREDPHPTGARPGVVVLRPALPRPRRHARPGTAGASLAGLRGMGRRTDVHHGRRATGVAAQGGAGVSMQDDQGDDSALGSRAALRTGVPSFRDLVGDAPSRDAIF